MADVSLTPTRLTVGTKSGNLATALANFTVQITTGQTFELILGGDVRGLVIILQDSGGSATPWVFDAGTYPPAMQKFQGAQTVTMSANDIRVFPEDPSRFVNASGSITGSCTGGTTKLTAFYMPLGMG